MVAPGPLSAFPDATNVMTLFGCIPLNAPLKKQLRTKKRRPLHWVLVTRQPLKGMPFIVKLNWPLVKPICLNLLIATRVRGQSRPVTSFATELSLMLQRVALPTELGITLKKPLAFTVGLSTAPGLKFTRLMVRQTSLTTIGVAQRVPRAEFSVVLHLVGAKSFPSLVHLAPYPLLELLNVRGTLF